MLFLNIYDFPQFETTRSFRNTIYIGKINIYEVEIDQSNLRENIIEFNNKSRPEAKEGKVKKTNSFDGVSALYEGRELTFNSFKSGISPIKPAKGEGLKTLTPKQVLQRLPIAFAQGKASNTSENLLNGIRQIIYTLYREKGITKKCEGEGLKTLTPKQMLQRLPIALTQVKAGNI